MMDGRLVAPRIPAIPMYGQPFNTSPFPAGYLPYGPGDASAFYPQLTIGENADAWRAGLTQAAAAACYDPALAAAHYGYGYGSMIGDGGRRKNATRETTSTLKAWLNEHRKNPYPTKGEKIMLAIITKMTLTQVSTWFANARRRLKKENKMTWSPRNRCGEDDDDDIIEGEDENNNLTDAHRNMKSDRASSRSVSPTAQVNPKQENGQRIPSFDLPQQPAMHPFLPRQAITGSFTIQRQSTRPDSAFQRQEDMPAHRSAPEDQDVDLESVDEDAKQSAMSKRSRSTDLQTHDHYRRRSQSPARAVPKSHQAFQPTSISSFSRGHHQKSHNAQSIGPNRTSRRDTISPRSHPYSRNVVVSPASTAASRSSSNSPTKPKIWSLAECAASNDNDHAKSVVDTPTNIAISKSSPRPGISAVFGNGPRPMQGLPTPHLHPAMNPEAHATLRNWMDGMMHQKMAVAMAAMSGGQAPPTSFFHGGLLPQHLGMNPAAIAMAASFPRVPESGRFPQNFPGFADFAAAQRAHMAATHAADLHAHPENVPHRKSPLSDAGKQSFDSSATRHRIISNEDKRKSPLSTASSPRLEIAEVSAFTALNTRPRSGDSGRASVETNNECLTQSKESSSPK